MIALKSARRKVRNMLNVNETCTYSPWAGHRKANPPAGSQQGRHKSVIDVGYPNPRAFFALCDQLSSAAASFAGKGWLGRVLMAPASDASGRGTAPPSPPPAEIRTQLERILDSPTFRSSPRRRAFLRHLVEETLAGRADGLKGYSVGLAVFGRDATFESQSDPVVRLEARRLRRDLDSYYVDAGARDPVRITIPKGHYVPHFTWHQAPTEAPPSDDTEREAGGGTVVGATGAAIAADEADRCRQVRARPFRRSASWPACSPSRSSRRPAGCGSGSAAHRRPSRRCAVRRSSSCPSRRSAPARTTASLPPA